MSDSIWPQLEQLLPRVSKPARYIGGELNTSVRDHGGPERVKFLLTFPDAYEIGQPNLGLAILYELLNEREDTLAERAYAPWPDLEGLMRAAGLPLFSVDSHMPASAFDVLAFTCPSELLYTNVLNCIDLAGYPVRSAARRSDAPLVIAGGHACFNPEPMAPFVDAFAIGDGEEVVVEIADAVREWKRGCLGPGGSRDARQGLMRRLASIEGVYVPALYEPEYGPDGVFAGLTAVDAAAPERVRKRVIPDLGAFPHPRRPVLPLTEVVHDRLAVEIFRGCVRGCRFCQAGMVTRPVRERKAGQVGELIDSGLACTGFEDVSLLSLSSADYSGVGQLLGEVVDRHRDDRVSVSLPSLRVDAFTVAMAAEIQRVQKTGLTFAPEAGSRRLRRVVNKLVSDDDLLAAVEAAYSQGWRRVKLYFMIGLPTETDEDVLAIAVLVKQVAEIGRRHQRGASVTASVGGFVPKAHTPLQWASQNGQAELDRKLGILKRELGSRGTQLRWHDTRSTVAEGLLARGDRRMADVIEDVWRAGGVFQQWSEHFDLGRWDSALAAAGLDLAACIERERRVGEALPWDVIDTGLTPEFLAGEWDAARQAAITEDCRWTPCYDCGVCTDMGVEHLVASETPPAGGSQGAGMRIPEVEPVS